MANVENFLKTLPVFGKKVKELRALKPEGQQALAEALGYESIKQVQRIEKGLIPKMETLVLLCEHYKYDFLSLIGASLLKGVKGNNQQTNLNHKQDSHPLTLEAVAASLLVLHSAVKKIDENNLAEQRKREDNARKQVRKDTGDGTNTSHKLN